MAIRVDHHRLVGSMLNPVLRGSTLDRVSDRSVEVIGDEGDVHHQLLCIGL